MRISLSSRRTTVIAIVVALAALLMLPSAAHASPAAPAERNAASVEVEFIRQINELRTSRGLAALQVDRELTAACRIWADKMRQDGEISHTKNLASGVSADWEKLGENVGVGGDVDSLMAAFIASPKHLENLVDPVFRYVGVGVVFEGDLIYTTHRFMKLFDTAPPPPKPKRPPTTAPRTTEPEALPVNESATTVPPATPSAPAVTSTTVPSDIAFAEPTPATPAPHVPPPAHLDQIIADLQILTTLE